MLEMLSDLCKYYSIVVILKHILFYLYVRICMWAVLAFGVIYFKHIIDNLIEING